MQSRSFRRRSGGSTYEAKSNGVAYPSRVHLPKLLTAENAEVAEKEKKWLCVLSVLGGERLFGGAVTLSSPNSADDRRQFGGFVDEVFVPAEAVPLEPVAESVAGQADARAGST